MKSLSRRVVHRGLKTRSNKKSHKKSNKKSHKKSHKRSNKKSHKKSRKNNFRKRNYSKRGGQNIDEANYMRAQQKHVDDQERMDREKEQMNIFEANKNKSRGTYLDPFNEWVDDVDYISQEADLNATDRQTEFNDRMDMEVNNDDDGPITFGGKRRMYKNCSLRK